MIEMITSLIETVSALVTFVINTIQSLISLIVNIPTYLAVVTNAINILPSFILPFALAFVTLVIVQYILNRRPD